MVLYKSWLITSSSKVTQKISIEYSSASDSCARYLKKKKKRYNKEF